MGEPWWVPLEVLLMVAAAGGLVWTRWRDGESRELYWSAGLHGCRDSGWRPVLSPLTVDGVWVKAPSFDHTHRHEAACWRLPSWRQNKTNVPVVATGALSLRTVVLALDRAASWNPQTWISLLHLTLIFSWTVKQLLSCLLTAKPSWMEHLTTNLLNIAKGSIFSRLLHTLAALLYTRCWLQMNLSLRDSWKSWIHGGTEDVKHIC